MPRDRQRFAAKDPQRALGDRVGGRRPADTGTVLGERHVGSANGSRKRKSADVYRVVWLPIDQVKPSPENVDIYGPIQHDEQMDALIDSIRRRGLLADPLRLTEDRYVISGHRRLYAIRQLGWEKVPCFITKGERRKDNVEYHKVLTEFNPQRIKTAGSLLREALLRDNDNADTYAAIESRRLASLRVDAEFMEVDRSKEVPGISGRRLPFLQAVQEVIQHLWSYWPLSIRQIHYQLLSFGSPPSEQ
jgi:ParB-like chromosome segregation protein Spo0J